MNYPKALKKGDVVGLAAPSFAVDETRVQRCVQALEALGFRVKVADTLAHAAPLYQKMQEELEQRAEEKQNAPLAICQNHSEDVDMQGFLESGYLGGNPRNRAADINAFFADKEVKGIFCVRGGYGSAQIMPYLDYELIEANPKVFCGFSDITNLLNVFAGKCEFVTYHAPMIVSNMVNAPFDDYTRESMFAAVMEDWKTLTFKNPENHPMQCFVPGHAAGRLVGGNVTVFARTCGTFYQPETRGKILFLEDVGESVASLDMYLTQMRNAGMFDGVQGILLGDFNDCKNSYNPSFDVDRMLRARLSVLGVPVLAHLRSGHETPMGTLPVGAWCEMDAENGSVRFRKRACTV